MLFNRHRFGTGQVDQPAETAWRPRLSLFKRIPDCQRVALANTAEYATLAAWRRAGDYTMSHLADEVAASPDFLRIERVFTRAVADPTMVRWFTDAFNKPRNPGRWKQIHATIARATAAGYLGCAAAILNFVPKLASVKIPRSSSAAQTMRERRRRGTSASRSCSGWPLRGECKDALP